MAERKPCRRWPAPAAATAVEVRDPGVAQRGEVADRLAQAVGVVGADDLDARRPHRPQHAQDREAAGQPGQLAGREAAAQQDEGLAALGEQGLHRGLLRRRRVTPLSTTS